MMSQGELEEARQHLEQEKLRLQQEWDRLNQERTEFEKERKESGIEYKLFIGNLDETTIEPEVREYTHHFGTIKEIVMLRDKQGQSKRSCFVKFYAKEAANNCLEALNGQMKDKAAQKFMVVRWADARPQANAPGAFKPDPTPYNNPYNPYGNAATPTFPSQPYNLPGYNTTYSTPHTSYTATRNPNSNVPASGGAVSVGFGRGPVGANLYVNNLAPNSSEHDVNQMFSDFGTVLSVKVFPSMNYGFVSYDNPQSAKYAIQSLNGLQLGDTDRRLEVSLKKDKNEGVKNTRFSPY